MERRGFGKTGHEVSVLGFGEGPVGYLKTARQEVTKILNMLLDRGVNLIDTAARSYQGSEIAIGVARDAGKIRFYGYSGDNEAAVYAAGLDEVAVIETSINICDQANIDNVLPLAQKNEIGILAKRPVANAAWREASEQGGIYVDYTRGYSDRILKMGIKPTDVGFPDDEYTTWAEMSLRFNLSRPGLSTAIVGTTKAANAERNMAVAEKGPLPAESVAKIRDAFRRAEAASGETWPGSR